MFSVQQCFVIGFENILYYFTSRLSLLVFPNNRHCISSPNIRPKSVTDFDDHLTCLVWNIQLFSTMEAEGRCVWVTHTNPWTLVLWGGWVKISLQWVSVKVPTCSTDEHELSVLGTSDGVCASGPLHLPNTALRGIAALPGTEPLVTA